jgi:dTDP-4-amino-4,6-dideoxygalactose transaminase
MIQPQPDPTQPQREGLTRIPLVRPRLADVDAATAAIHDVLESGLLTNGRNVRELERRAAEYLGVRHCVAVSSCTAGLMLVMRAAEVHGDVVVPSFTFAATAHAVAWNGAHPVFADVDAETLTLDPRCVERSLGVRTSAVVATHLYGTPCDVEALDAITREHGIRLFFDAAHAFGSRRRGVPVGRFGDAEVFSLSPTKVMVAAEGGLIATDDDELAERCRYGRDYGNPGDYDCRFVGLNARMSELHAVVALASLADLDDRIVERNRLAAELRGRLAGVHGVDFPRVGEGDRTTCKDFTILVDPEGYGRTAAELHQLLTDQGIETKRYYSPPVHRMQAYRDNGGRPLLPVTERAADRVLTLPLWEGMTGEIARIAGSVAAGQRAGAQERYGR